MNFPMKIWTSIDQVPEAQRILTLGNFDGLHRGHQSLVQQLKTRSEELGAKSCLMTFVPHPLKLLRPGGVKEIFTEKELIHQMQSEGLQELILQDFNESFSKLTPDQFLDLIIEKVQPKECVIGYDFRFGQGGQGTNEYFKSYCEARGIKVHIVEAVLDCNKPISSTRIRDCLSSGEMSKAQNLLGYPFFLYGKVVSGEQKGSQIGFPTLNMLPHEDFMLPNGVYKTSIEINGMVYPAVTNVGLAPTIRTYKILKTIETHVYDQELKVGVDQIIKVEFLSYIRPEKKFSGIKELVDQIRKDIAQVKSE